MPKHECREKPKPEKRCRFAWGEWDKLELTWCGKVMRCPNCGEKVNYRSTCKQEDCPYFEPKKWYKWRGWHPGIYQGEYLVE